MTTTTTTTKSTAYYHSRSRESWCGAGVYDSGLFSLPIRGRRRQWRRRTMQRMWPPIRLMLLLLVLLDLIKGWDRVRKASFSPWIWLGMQGNGRQSEPLRPLRSWPTFPPWNYLNHVSYPGRSNRGLVWLASPQLLTEWASETLWNQLIYDSHAKITNKFLNMFVKCVDFLINR